MGVIYFLLLPKSSIFRDVTQASTYMPISTHEQGEAEENGMSQSHSSTRGDTRHSARRPLDNDDNDEREDTVDDAAVILMPNSPSTGFIDNIPVLKPSLSTKEKLDLAKPLFMPFMIPLFVVYFAEVSASLYSPAHIILLH